MSHTLPSRTSIDGFIFFRPLADGFIDLIEELSTQQETLFTYYHTSKARYDAASSAAMTNAQNGWSVKEHMCIRDIKRYGERMHPLRKNATGLPPNIDVVLEHHIPQLETATQSHGGSATNFRHTAIPKKHDIRLYDTKQKTHHFSYDKDKGLFIIEIDDDPKYHKLLYAPVNGASPRDTQE